MSRPLKIALINTFYPPYNFGGDGVYVRRFAHALARQGCEVHVLHDVETFRALSSRKNVELSSQQEPQGVTVTQLSSPLGPIASVITHQTGRPLAYGRAHRRFFQQDFDVTHFHNVSLAGGPGILSMGSGVRLYTAHEHWLVCPTHILWRHKRELCDKRQCVKCQIIHRRPPQLWRMTGFLERQARAIDAFIALSQSSADNHKRFGFPFEMRVLPSFLPDEDQKIGESAHESSVRPYVLFVGRLEAIKGLQDLIPTFREGALADLVVVGEGDYGEELRRLAQGSRSIRFVGRKAPEDIGALYAGAVAVLLPSVCYEVFPLVALEAFRAGAPIIARDLGPFPEIIAKSDAGFLFRNAEEARCAVDRLVSEPALRADLGLRARSAFERHWSEKAALAAYFNLVAEKAAKKGLSDVAVKALQLVPK